MQSTTRDLELHRGVQTQLAPKAATAWVLIRRLLSFASLSTAVGVRALSHWVA